MHSFIIIFIGDFETKELKSMWKPLLFRKRIILIT